MPLDQEEELIAMGFLYGPIYSRRLGMSLGVDIIPYKTCSFNCIYCHEGETTCLTLERKDFFPPEEVLKELSTLKGQQARKGRRVDFITFAGSGEPTLNLSLGRYIRYLKEICPLPVAVITNSSLMWDKKVREELMAADLVVPSLDAVSEEIFSRVNRPYPELTPGLILEGLRDFLREYKGKVWLEILFCDGFNDGEEELAKLARAVKELDLEKIQLNTVSRPPAISQARPVSPEKLFQIKEMLGSRAELVEDVITAERESLERNLLRKVAGALRYGHSTLEELSRTLGLSAHEIIKILARLEKEGKVESFFQGGTLNYRLKR